MEFSRVGQMKKERKKKHFVCNLKILLSLS